MTKRRLTSADDAAARAELHWTRTRTVTPTEAQRLIMLSLAVHSANERFEAYVEDLYVSGASQSSIGKVLGITQRAISLRLRRRRRWQETARQGDVRHVQRVLQPLQTRTGPEHRPYGRGR